VPDVRRYLREFLMDGRVLDAPWPIRFFVVHCLILPFRPKQSAEAYHKIWTPEGSPLIVISKKVHAELQRRLPLPVELAMRYQEPSIPAAVDKLRAQGVTDLLPIPLFPHYAMSSFETAIERVKAVVARRAPGMQVRVQPPCYQDDDYITALVASAEPWLKQDFDRLLFSFHGLPERHLRKSDPTRAHCLTVKDCCKVPSPAHAFCYRHQCFATVNAFVAKAGLPASKYAVSFQSRLGRDPWLKPYTDFELARFAKEDVKKLVVMCPAFVSDCLETLEEIGLRGRETFLANGGSAFALVPCLNDNALWLKALENMVRRAFASGQ
jgi:ferrochelatase